MLKCKINGLDVEVEEGSTVLDAARKVGINIPTLCHMKLENFCFESKPSSCRLCMVEIKGRSKLCTACSEEVSDGMEISTTSPRAVVSRRINLELLLSNHPRDCLVCPKNMDCELQTLSHELGINKMEYQGEVKLHPIDHSSKAILRNPTKCIMCRRCETMCNEIQTVGALSGLDRGFDAIVGTAFKSALIDTSCTFCGQCVAVCPTGAIVAIDETNEVFKALRDPSKHVVVQVAPAIRVAIGELFGLEPGTITTGKLVTALKILGFDAVFDTDFSADLTVMEEASELVHRLRTNGRLPILTSCCPAWVRFFETNFPDMLDVPSSCKSPQVMMGAVVKSYYAEKKGIDPKDIVMVSIMPCTSKKEEANREEFINDGIKDVDIVMSTREIGKMIKWYGMDYPNLPESEFDQLLGESTGAAALFATTGGVIEAAVRTAYEWLTGDTLEKLEFSQLRGLEGVREAVIEAGELKLHIGIAHGLGNARKLVEGVRDGVYNFDAIEIMACPGGCIGGGGQPYHHGDASILLKRQKGIYDIDKDKPIRKSHENPMIKKIYEDYLGQPYGHKAHDLLHTHYHPRERI